MVDRLARDKAAKLLADFIEGRVSNEEFEDSYPIASADRALGAIFFASWTHHEDSVEHRVIDAQALDNHQRQLLQRCIAFLRSDLKYEWPSMMGRVVDKLRGTHGSSGDKGAWPFFRASDVPSSLGRSTQ